jgi:hypothetical protein
MSPDYHGQMIQLKVTMGVVMTQKPQQKMHLKRLTFVDHLFQQFLIAFEKEISNIY